LLVWIHDYIHSFPHCKMSGPQDWISKSGSRNFAIQNTWNGSCVTHEPMKVTISPALDGGCIMKVEGPFFNTSGKPDGPQGAFDGLWEYEVVEAFFLNDNNQYVEVELGPYGHHIVLLLDGVRNAVKTMLPMPYTATIKGDRWEGEATIPRGYFPPGVTKFNAYAIHGKGATRAYEALYPASGTAAPDFHDLNFFKSFDMTQAVNGYNPSEVSDVWKPFPPPTKTPELTSTKPADAVVG